MRDSWITDRRPTRDDTVNGCVWVDVDGEQYLWNFDTIELGQAWRSPIKPEPYIDVNKWEVRWISNETCYGIFRGGKLWLYLTDLCKKEKHLRAALEITEIYKKEVE